MKLTILAYSDIHYHKYQNGITLDDVRSVMSEFTKLAIELQPDLIVFGGDTYLSRNEMYEVILAASEDLMELAQRVNIPIAYLIGNHCRVYKSQFKLHTSEHLKLTPESYPGVKVLDTTTSITVFTNNGHEVCINAIPADYEHVSIKPHLKADFNICLFHATVIGSQYANGALAENGLSSALFNDDYDLVIGGDNHHHQRLVKTNGGRAWHVGAPMQHNWGDAGEKRGFVLFTIEKDDDDNVTVDAQHIESSAPKFMKVDVSIKSATDILSIDMSSWKNNVIRLTISADGNILDKFDIESWKTKLVSLSFARSVDIKLDYVSQAIIQDDEREMFKDADEWQKFLSDKAPELDSLDIDYLLKLGNKYIND